MKIIEEIIKLIFCLIVGTFLLWTGEIVITLLTLGWHRPKWSGYIDSPPMKRVFPQIGVGSIGFVFWMFSIPAVYNVVDKLKG